MPRKSRDPEAGRADGPAKPATGLSGMGRRRAAAKDEGGPAYLERREEIKQAAGELFKRHGYRGTSMARVAEALNLDRATLYYYVGSKEELFDDVVSQAVRANVEVAESILAREAPAASKLHELITSLMSSYADNYPFLYVFIQENLSQVARNRSAWSSQMRTLNKRYEDIVVQIIQQGIDEGTIRPVAEAWVQAYGLIGMVAWTNRWFHPGRSAVSAASIGESYASMLLGGMLAD
jgi:TetR/AcrR family transcriptional regulator, cholesterol catabolism regulator